MAEVCEEGWRHKKRWSGSDVWYKLQHHQTPQSDPCPFVLVIIDISLIAKTVSKVSNISKSWILKKVDRNKWYDVSFFHRKVFSNALFNVPFSRDEVHYDILKTQVYMTTCARNKLQYKKHRDLFIENSLVGICARKKVKVRWHCEYVLDFQKKHMQQKNTVCFFATFSQSCERWDATWKKPTR